MLYISTDLSRTIKNERLRSIAIVVLSTFAPANAEDPDANPEPYELVQSRSTCDSRCKPPPNSLTVTRHVQHLKTHTHTLKLPDRLSFKIIQQSPPNS
jgi:hypothetical protein